MNQLNVNVMEITNISKEALTRYFNILSTLGYKNYKEVDKLIVLLFIEELLTSELSYFINEQDYKTISNIIACLEGSSCMIDIPLYETYDSLIHKDLRELTYRITEDSILRYTENNLLRVD